MLNHLQNLKDSLIQEFFQLYEQYEPDQLYACALVLNEYLGIDYLAVSSTRSLFSEQEDSAEYLSEADKWNVEKWRYRTQTHSAQGLHQFKNIFADYFKQRYIYGNPLLNSPDTPQYNHLELLLDIFQQAKQALSNAYDLDLSQIVFLIHIPKQHDFEIYSAQFLNAPSALLDEFLLAHHVQHTVQTTNTQHNKLKLQQVDKDLLTDLAQLLEIEPYDYLSIAHEAYLLTLEPSFIDSNLYVQRLIQHVAAMDSHEQGEFALHKEEITQRIQQFYAT